MCIGVSWCLLLLQAKALQRMEQMRATFKQQALAKVQEAERAGLERCV